MPKPTAYPKRYGQVLGTVSVERGSHKKNIRLFSWDAINDCTDTRCIASEFCTYDRRGKCTIQANYLRAFSEVMFNNFGDFFSEADFYYVGMHLTPLYKTLCKLKIEELAVTRVVNVDEKGIRRVNPVYKEIRETIKLINILWKSMGMTRGIPVVPDPDFDDDGDYIDGQVESPMGKQGLVKR